MDIDYIRDKLIEGHHKIWHIEMEMWKGGRCLGCNHWNANSVIDDATIAGHCNHKGWTSYGQERCADFTKRRYNTYINRQPLLAVRRKPHMMI